MRRSSSVLTRAVAPLIAPLLATAAAAQDSAPPIVITPPAPSFSLPPANPTPTPTPTPSTAPTPVAPPPVVATTPSPSPATRAPRPAPTATPRAARPASIPVPTPFALPPATPRPTTTPTPARTAVPVAAAVESGGTDWWPWIAGLAGLFGVAGFVMWRRGTRGNDRLDPVAAPAVVPRAQPSPPAAPLTPSAPPRVPAPPQAPAGPRTAPPAPATHGIAVEVRPLAMAVDATRALLDFELAVANVGGSPADGIRALVGMTTAGPDLAAHLAAFSTNAALAVATDAFTLMPGEARRIATRLDLPRESMHVANAGGRTMIVPVVMVGLRWRGGLSVRALAETHMIGTGGGARLGPVWFDGQPRRYDGLAARRFVPTPNA